jgi:hypothetical protein
MSAPKNPNPPIPVESKNPMSPKRSSAPEEDEPPLLRELELELELELDRELELDELRELEPLDLEPPLKDWPPPGRASKKVMFSRAPGVRADIAVTSIAAARAERAVTSTGLAAASATDVIAANIVMERWPRGELMRAARREAR